jgi:hypothetical protein
VYTSYYIHYVYMCSYVCTTHYVVCSMYVYDDILVHYFNITRTVLLPLFITTIINRILKKSAKLKILIPAAFLHCYTNKAGS